MNERPPVDTPPPPHRSSFLDSRWLVLALLFLVTGALGVPILWASGAFSRNAKILLTLVVTIYTLLICTVAALIVLWAYQRVMQAFAMVTGL
jgi:hypothetical protein